MAVMDKMCGSWKLDFNKTENEEAYLDAMGAPAEFKKKLLNEKNITVQMTRDGDTFNTTMTIGDYVDKVNFKLNEKFKGKFMGMEVENIFRVEGDVVIGEHEVDGKVAKSRRYMNGDTEAVVELEADGVIAKYSYIKC